MDVRTYVSRGPGEGFLVVTHGPGTSVSVVLVEGSVLVQTPHSPRNRGEDTLPCRR